MAPKKDGANEEGKEEEEEGKKELGMGAEAEKRRGAGRVRLGAISTRPRSVVFVPSA